MGTDIRDVIDLPYPFFIYNLVYGNYHAVEISKDEYFEIGASKEILRAAKSIEEKYDVLLESYIELEEHIASICIKARVRGHHDYADVYETLRDLNTRISVFLSIAKMYTDHLCSDAGTIKNGKWNFSKFVSEELVEHRANKYFLLAEALRNYAQHVGVSVGSTEIIGQRNNGAGESVTWFQAMKIWAPREDLARVRYVRTKVLSQFEDGKIDLKHTIGEYMSGLSSIHHLVRAKLDLCVSGSRDCLTNWCLKYQGENNIGPFHALTAIMVEDEKIVEEIQMRLDWEEVRQRLVSRNHGVKNFSDSYITTMSATNMQSETIKNK